MNYGKYINVQRPKTSNMCSLFFKFFKMFKIRRTATKRYRRGALLTLRGG